MYLCIIHDQPNDVCLMIPFVSPEHWTHLYVSHMDQFNSSNVGATCWYPVVFQPEGFPSVGNVFHQWIDLLLVNRRGHIFE